MVKRVVQFVVVVGLVLSFSMVFASEVKELEAVYPNGGKINWRVEDRALHASFYNRVLCVDGLKVFQTVAFTYSKNGGVATSSVQLMEEKNGKVVPVRCQ